jgi:hypothetical protein
MEVMDVARRRDQFRLDLLALAQKFSDETQCVIDATLRFRRVDTHLMGQDAPAFSNAAVYTVEVEVHV